MFRRRFSIFERKRGREPRFIRAADSAKAKFATTRGNLAIAQGPSRRIAVSRLYAGNP